VVLLSSNVEGRLVAGTILTTEPVLATDPALPRDPVLPRDHVPPKDQVALTIERSRRHQDRWLVKFVGVDSREAAESIGRPVLYGAPLDSDDDDVLWIHELIGCTVFEKSGLHSTGLDQTGLDNSGLDNTGLDNTGLDNTAVERGTVVEVQDNPASDLLVLSTGALVPLTFVTSVNEGVITVEVPDGLFELYEG